MSTPSNADERHYPKYTITIIAELTGFHPQQIRRFEKSGLIAPARSLKGTRRYSDEDLVLLREIIALCDAGVNQAGIDIILQLRHDMFVLHEQLAMAEDRARASEMQLQMLLQKLQL